MRVRAATLLVLAVAVLLDARALGGGAPPPAGFDHAELDRILRAVVVGEGVDYRGVRERHLADLDRYLDRVARADPAGLSRAERLALYINLYNATVVGEVARRHRPNYSPAENDFALFDEPLIRVAGRRVSLNELEHGILRREFDEPRIHVAVVCAARSCPPLLPRAWAAADLESLLERQMRRFLADPSRNRIDPTARRLALSRIFDWYAEDFGGAGGVAAYVDRFTDVDVSGYTVGFLPYSWKLNDASR